VAGYVHEGLLYTYCPERTPETAGFLTDPGRLVTPGFDAVLLHAQGVFQGVFAAPVVPPLPGQEGVQLVADRPVGITSNAPGRRR
jgi:hypothetical protein